VENFTFSTPLIWFLIGVLFLIAELLLPGFILIFFTLGSWTVALLVWLVDMDLTYQILIFIVASLIPLITLRKKGLEVFKGKTREGGDDSYEDSKIGKRAVVTKAIKPNLIGEVKFSGSFWRAISDEEIEEGAPVVIEKQESEDGLIFKVKPIKE
jgi:membrane protein implicated in regulation of membrane protease activity